MSENKYQFRGTQGEWGAYFGRGGYRVHALDLGGRPDIVRAATKSKEDIYLCAAAPELLQACIEAEKIFDYMNIHALGETERKSYENMKQAISKALNINE